MLGAGRRYHCLVYQQTHTTAEDLGAPFIAIPTAIRRGAIEVERLNDQ
jgi:hypothetical protein